MYGSDDEEIKFSYDDGYEKYSHKKSFEGVINNLERRYLETDSDWKREEISQYQSETNCEKCKGLRLKDEALWVKINKLNISQITQFSIDESQKWFSNLENILTLREKKIAQHILKEINERLNFLLNVGLDYLTLARESSTLSGGEGQRIRLASQIGSGLTGVLYVLDEPSIGLHQKDNKKLIQALKRLRDLGNTIIVVEHDTETMESADHIIDLGPEAGIDGGSVVAEGSLKDIIANEKSITGNYLSGKKNIFLPERKNLSTRGLCFATDCCSGAEAIQTWWILFKSTLLDGSGHANHDFSCPPSRAVFRMMIKKMTLTASNPSRNDVFEQYSIFFDAQHIMMPNGKEIQTLNRAIISFTSEKIFFLIVFHR